MRILVTGGSGFVGWRLVESFSAAGDTVGYTYYSTIPNRNAGETHQFQVNVLDRDRVVSVMEEFVPDVVIHAAAMTDADECERNPSQAWALNVDGTRHVAESCEHIGASIALLSSSFVFDGRDGPYMETDATNPVNKYGETKVAAESVVSNAAVDHLVCRIDQPYGWLAPWQDHTFVEWVLKQCERGEPFPVFDDWHNTPVYLRDISNAFRALLARGAQGLYHVVGPDYVSRYIWARTIAEVFGYKPELARPEDSCNADLKAPRPSTHLSNRKIRNETGYSFNSLHQGLIDMRDTADATR